MNRIPPKALDGRGFIIDQSLTGVIPFGRKGSVACGCGWIAAYNLRRWRGDPVEPETVARTLHRLSPFSGFFGVNVFFLWLYLLFLGMWPLVLPVTRKSRRVGAGILMYRVKGNGHYAAFLPGEEGKVLFLNGVYGARGHEMVMGDYLKEFSRWPLGLVITVQAPRSS